MIGSVSYDGARYEVSLPWKELYATLPDNLDLSQWRLSGLLKQLQHDPKILQEYDAIIRSQVWEQHCRSCRGSILSNYIQGALHSSLPVIRKDKPLPKYALLLRKQMEQLWMTVWRKLLDFLTRECGGNRPRKVYYMSDGCAAQYILCCHLDDFGVRAEWHVFATSLGKSAGDGALGTSKWVACRASLQRPYQDQILTARQLYKFAISKIKGMHFTFISQEEHDRETSLLEERLKASRTVPGNQKLHCFVQFLTILLKLNLFQAVVNL